MLLLKRHSHSERLRILLLLLLLLLLQHRHLLLKSHARCVLSLGCTRRTSSIRETRTEHGRSAAAAG
jgi:flagellar biosynthesis protein FliP